MSFTAVSVRASRTKGLNGRVHANTSPHGVEPMDKFVPVEHPSEPLEADKPTWCPRPEPCIMHDGRIWKERITAKLPQKAERRASGGHIILHHWA
ncbi:hypothetical protein CY35_02G140900 [Sphagnum magellanicum]|nr:hypothetical protein CY35_02G140900 [Sphagnum magellanicum]